MVRTLPAGALPPLADVDTDRDAHDPQPTVPTAHPATQPQATQPATEPSTQPQEKKEATEASPLEWDTATGPWFGLRPLLQERGVTFQGLLTMDWSKNLRGGLNTEGWAFRHLLNAGITVGTEPLMGFKGGVFFINFQDQNGANGSHDDVGDIQGFDNIDTGGASELSELWYEQTLLDGKLRVKLGKVDANREFAYTKNGGDFLNSSMGFSPTIFVLPTYPNPATSINVFVYPTDQFYAGIGLYDGATQDGEPTGPRGPSTFWGSPSDLFLVGEVGMKWELGDTKLTGRAGIGGWHHTGTFTRLDGDGSESGTSGAYVVADQDLWKKNPSDDKDARGVSAFFQYGYADREVAAIDHHVGGGVAWTGPIPTRDTDIAGMGLTWAHLNTQPAAAFDKSYELTLEGFYKFYATPFLSLKPDLQFIVNPGGQGLHNALVATVRVDIEF